MKLLIPFVVLALVGCGPVPESKPQEVAVPQEQGCTLKKSSNLVNEHNVGPIQNLEKDEFELGYRNECTVRFDITVNGQLYHLEETVSSLEQMASVCYQARERARSNLLLDLGGNFKSEMDMKCYHKETQNG